MTVVANMLMNTQMFPGPKTAQTNPKKGEGAFGKVVAEALGLNVPQEQDEMTSEQLLNLLAQFQDELNDQNGTDLSLEEVIGQLHTELSHFQQIPQPLLKNLVKTMPILEPLDGNGEEIIKDLKQSGMGRPMIEVMQQIDPQLFERNMKPEGRLQEFIKFLMKNDALHAIPQQHNLKQMLMDLQGKAAPQSTGNTTAPTNDLKMTSKNFNQSMFFHMKNQPAAPAGKTGSQEIGVQLPKSEGVTASGLFSVTSPTNMSKVEQFILHAPQEHTPSSQFGNDLAKILNRGRIMTLPNGSTQLSIKLFPENLGSLDIQIVQRNGEIAAKIIASTVQAKELIETNLHQLRHSLQSQNINIDKIEISSHTPEWMSDDPEHDNQQSSSREQTHEEGHKNEEENQGSFEQLLKEMGIDEEV
ncbi:flagellar hook-length control protein FliK [Bacillus sp. Marseille-Q3570]|uniref:flagellar hook-length control protein FliK n=1 Tax=Bacillus sp. Marseille-Q3570 TaxID=2963522 RepID=UPI0021B82099|nr:flagellar hook-length control protein FliK [Bacillus sp. Marseille-Q3570]